MRREGNRAGFAVTGLILALGIMAFIGFAFIGSYRAIAQAKQPTDASATYALALREAMLSARQMAYDTQWGVRIASSSIVVFSGTSYATRTAARDRTFAIAPGLTVTGSLERVFSKYAGVPTPVGTTTFQNTVASSSAGINAAGAIYITP